MEIYYKIKYSELSEISMEDREEVWQEYYRLVKESELRIHSMQKTVARKLEATKKQPIISMTVKTGLRKMKENIDALKTQTIKQAPRKTDVNWREKWQMFRHKIM